MSISDVEKILLTRLMAPGDSEPLDVYRRASFGNEDWFNAMLNHHWMPAWPVLKNAGTPKQQLMPCFVLGIEDTLESIMETMTRCALIFKYGGSTGINISSLRPKNSPLSMGGTAAGPLAFMKGFDVLAETISQSGLRRGGFMIVMDDTHPDVHDFIKCKDKEGSLANMNISVRLVDPSESVVIPEIAEHVWKSGEPGVLYGPALAPYECVNLCGEVPLPPWGVCNLGSVNVAKCFTSDRKPELDVQKLETATKGMGTYLDFIIDKNWYIFEEQMKEELSSRRIGVGILGFHELINKLGIMYEDSVEVAGHITKVMMETLKQLFPNAMQLMSIAPTGTIHMLCGTTPGIEPIPARELEVYSPLGNLKVIYNVTGDKVASEIPWKTHVDVQSAFQENVDGSISKTILFKNDVTPHEIEECINYAGLMGCVGLTMYRVGSRVVEAQNAVITSGKTLRTETGYGKMFTTLNTYGGKNYECFFTIGRSGSLVQSFTEAIGRLVSLSLQHNVPLNEIIEQLEGIRSPQQKRDDIIGFNESVPDAIGKALKYLSEVKLSTRIDVGECPKCFGPTTISEGCEHCVKCGWSRCGT